MRTRSFFITGLLCLIFSIQTLCAQNLNTRISLRVKDATLPQVLQLIQKKYGYRFSYLNNELPAKMKFTAEITNKPLSEVLDVLLAKTDIGYKQSGGQVIIKKGFPKAKPKPATFQKFPVSAPEKPIENKAGQTFKTTSNAEAEKNKQLKGAENMAEKKPVVATENQATTTAGQPNENAFENATDLAANSTFSADENVKDTLTVIKMAGKKESFLDKLATIRLKNETKAANTDTILMNEYHFGIFPPISTNGSQANQYVNNMSAHLLVGAAAGLEGVEFSGFGNVEKSYVSGLQFAGFFNVAKNSQGLSTLAETRNEGYSLHGLQFAGFFNLANGNVKGGQFGGYMNIAAGHMRGAQFAGFLNIAKNTHGVQGAGYMNLAKNVEGAQLAGFLNVADTVSGLQAAGFLNVAKTVKGTQIAVVNVADSVSGVPIGLFTFVKRGGYRRAEFYVSDDFDANFTYKLGVQKFYTFLALGAELNDKKRWGYGFGFGREWRPGKRFRVNTDLMAYNVIEESYGKFPKGFLESDELNLLNKFRLLATLQLTNRIALFGGPVYNVFVSRYQEPSLEKVGSTLVTDTFFDHTSSNGTNVKMWVGFNAGIRF